MSFADRPAVALQQEACNGTLRGEISTALAMIYRKSFGRGPTSTATYEFGAGYVTFLGEVLQPHERALVRTGRADLVVEAWNGDPRGRAQLGHRPASAHHRPSRAARLIPAPARARPRDRAVLGPRGGGRSERPWTARHRCLDGKEPGACLAHLTCPQWSDAGASSERPRGVQRRNAIARRRRDRPAVGRARPRHGRDAPQRARRDRPPSRLVLDLRGLSFIDSSGLHFLSALDRRAGHDGSS